MSVYALIALTWTSGCTDVGQRYTTFRVGGHKTSTEEMTFQDSEDLSSYFPCIFNSLFSFLPVNPCNNGAKANTGLTQGPMWWECSQTVGCINVKKECTREGPGSCGIEIGWRASAYALFSDEAEGILG